MRSRRVGIAINLNEREVRRIVRLLQHIEACDARLLYAIARVVERGGEKGVDVFGEDVDEDLDGQHG